MWLNFTIDMTWGRLILLNLRQKRPKNQSPDTRGAGKWRLSQCTVAPAAFWKCVFWDTLFVCLHDRHCHHHHQYQDHHHHHCSYQNDHHQNNHDHQVRPQGSNGRSGPSTNTNAYTNTYKSTNKNTYKGTNTNTYRGANTSTRPQRSNGGTRSRRPEPAIRVNGSLPRLLVNIIHI